MGRCAGFWQPIRPLPGSRHGASGPCRNGANPVRRRGPGMRWKRAAGLTGSYDVETGTLYWTVGNPYPATDGDERRGSNLYTNCVIALDVKTGKLRWHYQFTPHDLHDWDATEPLVLVDTDYRGRPRK